MKVVITYGTYDLLHNGHIKLLERAKKLGHYLIVGVTSDAYDKERGKLNVHDSLLTRIDSVKNLGIADKIIVEEYEGQKILDIEKYGVNVFAIGSDWLGEFDYLKEQCEVVYLDRTKNISSTILRQKNIGMTTFGIIGTGRIARRFIKESKYVSGVNIEGVYNPRKASAETFSKEQEIGFYTDKLEELFERATSIYIAAPHQYHYEYIKESLNAGKNVLCEKPLVLKEQQCKEMFALAEKKGLVLMEAVKTAYCPGFEHLLLIAKSGKIGSIKDIEAAFTMLKLGNGRELNKTMAGGSMNELASYPLLPIIKLLGTNYQSIQFFPYMKDEIDLFTKTLVKYPHATASFKVGLGAKTEGELIITGTKGYIYVPAPWWKTEYFEIRFEDANCTNKYFYKFEEDGLRYEIMEFVSMIKERKNYSYKLTAKESIMMAKIIETFGKGEECFEI